MLWFLKARDFTILWKESACWCFLTQLSNYGNQVKFRNHFLKFYSKKVKLEKLEKFRNSIWIIWDFLKWLFCEKKIGKIFMVFLFYHKFLLSFSTWVTNKNKNNSRKVAKVFKMPKLRKQRRNQKFRYHINRKRVKKSQETTRKDRIKVNK